MWLDTCPGFPDSRDLSVQTVREIGGPGHIRWLPNKLFGDYSIFQFGFSGLSTETDPLALTALYHVKDNDYLAPAQPTPSQPIPGTSILVTVYWHGPNFRTMPTDELKDFLQEHLYKMNLSKATFVQSNWRSSNNDFVYRYTHFPLTGRTLCKKHAR
jgi:hypothetical protein